MIAQTMIPEAVHIGGHRVVGLATLAGYLGGRWDNFLMRVVDILYSLPSILFVIVLIDRERQGHGGRRGGVGRDRLRGRDRHGDLE